MLRKSDHLNLNLESFPEKILEENENNTDSEVDDVFDSPPKSSSKDLWQSHHFFLIFSCDQLAF